MVTRPLLDVVARRRVHANGHRAADRGVDRGGATKGEEPRVKVLPGQLAMTALELFAPWVTAPTVPVPPRVPLVTVMGTVPETVLFSMKAAAAPTILTPAGVIDGAGAADREDCRRRPSWARVGIDGGKGDEAGAGTVTPVPPVPETEIAPP